MNDKQMWRKYKFYNYIRVKYPKMYDKIAKKESCNTNEKLEGKTIMNIEETFQIIANAIEKGEPFFAGRFGQTELNMMTHVLNERYEKISIRKKAAFKQLCLNAGFFPNEMTLSEKFVDLMLTQLPNLDLHGTWPLVMEDYMIAKYEKEVQLTRLGYLHPYIVSRESGIKPWSRALAGKKVLVIHPFAETIQNQYYNHRTEIFKNVLDADDILPRFELKTLKAVQTIAGNRDERFNTWFEALDWMKEECKKIDFDVAILGCGAYGFPLASEIKRMGKVAIHMGGGLQIMFGIKGKRWENPEGNYDWYMNAVNESWVRPSKDEMIKGNSQVENGCYW